jgi:hypothetical protein
MMFGHIGKDWFGQPMTAIVITTVYSPQKLRRIDQIISAQHAYSIQERWLELKCEKLTVSARDSC